MPKPTNALDILGQKTPPDVKPVCVLFGDEPFLKRLALAELRRAVLGDDEGDFSLTTFDGETVEPRDVFDELATIALFGGGGQRMAVVEDADDFVSRHRPVLEDYVARSKANGVLVLSVKTWPSNTKLYKALEEKGLQIDCKFPAPAALVKWLTTWTKTAHHAKLDRDAAELLVEIVEPHLGLIDQELAKLAAFAGNDGTITAENVRQLVGGWRAQTTWDMLDAAAGGDARAALVQLDRLILSGEEPIGVLAQIGSSLRRFATAARIIAQAEATGKKPMLRGALETAGFKPFVIGKAEGQLKQLGRQRALQMYRWLLEADLALKGQSSKKDRARIVLEQLIVRLSTLTDPRKKMLRS